MSKQDDQDFCIMVVTICALVLAFLFMCCAIKTVLDKQHRPAVKASEEVTTTEETQQMKVEEENKHEKRNRSDRVEIRSHTQQDS